MTHYEHIMLSLFVYDWMHIVSQSRIRIESRIVCWKVRKISSCDNDKNHTRTTWKFFVVVTTLQRRTISTALLLGWYYGWCDMTLYINNCSMLFLEANCTSNSFADTVDSRRRTIVAYC